MLLRALPLVVGLAPIAAIHLSFAIAIRTVGLQSCIPYLGGCTSISATGREPPASFVFKGVLMPEAMLLALYWLLSVAWLRALQRQYEAPVVRGAALAFFGVTGAMFLVLYTGFLGSDGSLYGFMRRFGVYIYFAFTVFAELILAISLLRIELSSYARRLARVLLALAAAPFALGVLNLVLKAVLEDARAWEYRIEWLFALLMHVYFVVTYFLWRHTKFTARFTVGEG